MLKDLRKSPAALFNEFCSKAHFIELFHEFIEDTTSVGRDGTRATVFSERLDEEIDILLRKIRSNSLTFTPYKERLISKGASNLPRQIAVPTVRDKLALKFVSELLAKIFPTHTTNPPHKIIKRVHELASTEAENRFFLRIDIKNYYGSVDHKILMRLLRRTIRKKELLLLIERAIATPVGRKRVAGEQLERGLPQGLSISNILASLYLEDIDEEVRDIEGVEYFRFVDDILIVCDAEAALHLKEYLPKRIKRIRKILCHDIGEGSKSALVRMEDGIDYLGYNFKGKSLSIRKSSYRKMHANVMKIVTQMKYKSVKSPLIWRLNLRITGCKYLDKRIGWLFFFSQSNDVHQIKKMESFIKKKCSSVLSDEELGRVKSIHKAYFEVKYNHRDSLLIPDFDNFDDEQKRRELRIFLPDHEIVGLEDLSSKDLDKKFKKSILREIRDIERDMLEAFS